MKKHLDRGPAPPAQPGGALPARRLTRVHLDAAKPGLTLAIAGAASARAASLKADTKPRD